MKILQKKTNEEDLELAKMSFNNDFILPKGSELIGNVIIQLNPYGKIENLLMFKYQNNEYAYRTKLNNKYDEFILLF